MTRRRAVLGSLGAGALGGLSGCSSPRETSTPETDRTASDDGVSLVGPADAFAYTHLTPSRNRRLDTGAVSADLSGVEPTDVSLDGRPVWLVARPVDDGAEWVVATENGGVTGVRVTADGTDSVAVSPDSLPVGAPPLVRREGSPSLVAPPDDAASHTHPLPVDGGYVVVTEDRRVLLRRDGEETVVTTNTLPDARLVTVGGDTAAVLREATDVYNHGALGDGTEARELLVFDTGDGSVVRRNPTASDRVFEAIGPLVGPFADLDPALVVTETEPAVGARLVAFGLDGERVAGPLVGRRFRWRHALCVAPFAPDGVPELAVVKTPHIGGTVEFYRLAGDRLEIAATFEGASSHANGSRNLDGAFAADVDGDGRPELVVPNDARTELQVLRRTASGVELAFSLPVAGRITSNVHGVATAEGIQVAVARDGGLRVWRYI